MGWPVSENRGFLAGELAESRHVFQVSQEVRILIYTTNSIENFNRGLRKVTKSKSVFPSDDALLKMLYLAIIDITKKWTGAARTGDNALLNFRLWKHRFNRVGKAGQPVHTGNQDIPDTPVL